MKLAHFFRHLALLMLASVSLAFAQERGTADEAKAMADNGLAHIKAVGPDKAFADFSEKEGKWHNKDLYIFAVKFDGTVVAQGANKALIGKNLMDLKDPDGKFFIKEMIELGKAKGNGWVDYSYTDPQTKKFAPKSSYVARVPGYDGILGVGIYKK